VRAFSHPLGGEEFEVFLVKINPQTAGEFTLLIVLASIIYFFGLVPAIITFIVIIGLGIILFKYTNYLEEKKHVKNNIKDGRCRRRED